MPSLEIVRSAEGVQYVRSRSEGQMIGVVQYQIDADIFDLTGCYSFHRSLGSCRHDQLRQSLLQNRSLPTGMKAGVYVVPCGRVIRAKRAFVVEHLASTSNRSGGAASSAAPFCMLRFFVYMPSVCRKRV